MSLAWTSAVTITAAATLTLAQVPGSLVLLALALAGFGGAYTALSGVLIAWGDRLAPAAPAQATAVLSSPSRPDRHSAPSPSASSPHASA